MKKEDRVDRRYEETINTIKTQASRSRRKMTCPPNRAVLGNLFTHLVATYNIAWRREESWNRGPGACFTWEKVNRTLVKTTKKGLV